MKTFVISDQHYGHNAILTFKTIHGDPVRNGFQSVDHMNQVMIERHNSVVTDEDKVYFLGDVVYNRKEPLLKAAFNEVMPQLKGRKTLILGNHDSLEMSEYRKYFGSIYSARYLNINGVKVVLCHYPMHINANEPNYPICIHGHIHEKKIIMPNSILEDKRYINVCVEQINYTPVDLENLILTYKAAKQ